MLSHYSMHWFELMLKTIISDAWLYTRFPSIRQKIFGYMMIAARLCHFHTSIIWKTFLPGWILSGQMVYMHVQLPSPNMIGVQIRKMRYLKPFLYDVNISGDQAKILNAALVDYIPQQVSNQ